MLLLLEQSLDGQAAQMAASDEAVDSVRRFKALERRCQSHWG
jgi:hypothetical protein